MSTRGILIAGLCGCLLLAGQTCEARVRLENLCTLQGQQEINLLGVGLVTGLQGTGDGAKNLATIRALQAALTRMNAPIAATDIQNGNNVAVVFVSVQIPRTGLRRGQKLDCTITAPMGAKSLQGGQLMSTPLTTSNVRDEIAWALANGEVIIQDVSRATAGRIIDGASMLRDATPLFLNDQQGSSVTLQIDPHHASFWTSSEVARVVNSEFSFEVGGQQVAKPLSPNAVEVTIPPQYRESPVDFVAQVLDVGIDIPNTQARVVINAKTGTVIVTGEVELSPVIITQKSFSVEVGPNDLLGPGPFVGLVEGQGRQSPQQLKDLVDALNQLRVPAADIIAIIRELHQSGKLHAELIER